MRIFFLFFIPLLSLESSPFFLLRSPGINMSAVRWAMDMSARVSNDEEWLPGEREKILLFHLPFRGVCETQRGKGRKSCQKTGKKTHHLTNPALVREYIWMNFPRLLLYYVTNPHAKKPRDVCWPLWGRANSDRISARPFYPSLYTQGKDSLMYAA